MSVFGKEVSEAFRSNGTAVAPAVAASDTRSLGTTSAIGSASVAYHELSGELKEVDALSQLNANLSQLEDLHGRMKFMMTELKTLIKRS